MSRVMMSAFLACLMFGGMAFVEQTVTPASAAEQAVQQAAPAQAAVVKNKKGEVIKVYSFMEGGVIAVMPDGAILSGDDAVAALAAEGLQLSVGPDGAMQVAGDSSAIITAPRPATPAEAAAARAAASPAAPTGAASDGGRMSMESFNTSMGASGMPGNLSGTSVSK